MTLRRRRHQVLGMRTFLIAIGLVVSGVFMYIAVRGAHLEQTVDALRTTNYAWLGPSLGLFVVAFFIRCVRWQSLFSRTARPPLRAVVSSQFVGYCANAVLPVRAGDAAAIVALNKKAGTPIAEGTATLLVQRAEDVLSLVLLLFVMLPWLPHVSWLRAAGIFALALALALALIAALVVHFGDRAIQILLRPLTWLPFMPRDALNHAPAHFVRGLVGLVSFRVAVISFAWTTLSWIVLGVGYWLVLEASGLDLSPLAGILVMIGIGLAMILPSSPAALGVFEGATVVVLSAYDVPDSIALSYALVLHVLNVLPLLLVAGVMLILRRARRRSAVRGAFPDSALEP